MVLLGLGDSVTAGFGADPGKSYFDRLVENPLDEFEEMQGRSLSVVYPNLVAQNISVNGSNSIEHWSEQVADLKPFSEDTLGIVVFTTGGNDLIHWYGANPPKEGAMYGATLEQAEPWVANFEQRLVKMLDRIGEAFPGGHHVFLANIYDPSDGVGNPAAAGMPAWNDMSEIHRRYNEVIERVAEERPEVHLVDIHGLFLGHGAHCTQFWRPHYQLDDPTYWYFSNIEDPNERGYDALRRLFLLKMIETLQTTT